MIRILIKTGATLSSSFSLSLYLSMGCALPYFSPSELAECRQERVFVHSHSKTKKADAEADADAETAAEAAAKAKGE